jgi:hypothetical protein
MGALPSCHHETVPAAKWIAKALDKVPDGDELYEKITPAAKGLKAIIQATIGVAAVIVLIIQLCLQIPAGKGALNLGDVALAIIGTALAFSAAVELAYTFFTDGPDEAIDPLILGISSFALIEISRKKAHLQGAAVPILFVAISIVILFATRKFLGGTDTEGATTQKDTTKDEFENKNTSSPEIPLPRQENTINP